MILYSIMLGVFFCCSSEWHYSEFGWDESVSSMEQFPPDDVLGSLYKSRIRESEKLKTVLELYNLEIHQKKAKPDYHRLKTMLKISIEQDLRFADF